MDLDRSRRAAASPLVSGEMASTAVCGGVTAYRRESRAKISTIADEAILVLKAEASSGVSAVVTLGKPDGLSWRGITRHVLRETVLAEGLLVTKADKSEGRRETETRPCHYCRSSKRPKVAKVLTFRARAKRAEGSSERRSPSGLSRPSIGKSKAVML